MEIDSETEAETDPGSGSESTPAIAFEAGAYATDPTPRAARTFPSLQLFSTIVIVGGAMLFLLATLHPGLILKGNTPTGGDMGAHVWGPAFLRDNLLSNLRLSGWTMDWYSGFPIYRFYMVVPALFIVLLDVVLPYGIAFKLVAVAGIVALPLCAWAFGRLARFVYPLPELFAVAATVFLYDESFTIYGGNIASTMAGEFSFSIALAGSGKLLGADAADPGSFLKVVGKAFDIKNGNVCGK